MVMAIHTVILSSFVICKKYFIKKKEEKKKENETSTYITMYSVDVIYVNCNGKGFH